MNDTINGQYNNPQIAAGFEALGHGREKSSIAQYVIDFAQPKFTAKSVALVLGVGTGWEIDLLHKLNFDKIVGYDPGNAMLEKARALVSERKYTNVELYGNSSLEIEEMDSRFSATADFVIGTHVIPAIETREQLVGHFRDYQKFLTANGHALAITNNPDDQFHGYDSYSCHYDGNNPNDGMLVRTIIHDVKIGAKEVEIEGERYTSGGKSLMVVDTFWSEQAIRQAIREAGMKLTGTGLIDLDNENQALNLLNVDQAKVPSEALYSPYTAYILRKTHG